MNTNPSHWDFFCYMKAHFFIICQNIPKLALSCKYVRKWGILGYCEVPINTFHQSLPNTYLRSKSHEIFLPKLETPLDPKELASKNSLAWVLNGTLIDNVPLAGNLTTFQKSLGSCSNKNADWLFCLKKRKLFLSWPLLHNASSVQSGLHWQIWSQISKKL